MAAVQSLNIYTQHDSRAGHHLSAYTNCNRIFLWFQDVIVQKSVVIYTIRLNCVFPQCVSPCLVLLELSELIAELLPDLLLLVGALLQVFLIAVLNVILHTGTNIVHTHLETIHMYMEIHVCVRVQVMYVYTFTIAHVTC